MCASIQEYKPIRAAVVRVFLFLKKNHSALVLQRFVIESERTAAICVNTYVH